MARVSGGERSGMLESARIVNDVHSQLNQTVVSRIVRPETVEGVREVILQARAEGQALGTAGGRHAMGGQQFAT